MHKRTQQIIKNLGYDDAVINQINKKPQITRKSLAYLKNLGMPEMALKQIKFLEDYSLIEFTGKSNKELIESLIKKCRRSLDAFANKKVAAKIVFENQNWTLYSSNYTKTIEKLHTVCKPYFDSWAAANVEVTFIFDGSNSWKIATKKESDLPGN